MLSQAFADNSPFKETLMPTPPRFPLSGPELLRALEKGETPASLAEAHSVSAQCVRWHVRQLQRFAAAPAARRADELVSHTLGAFAEIAENLRCLRLLRVACLDQLQHPYDPAALDVGPHDYDLEATVSGGPGEPPLRRSIHELAQGAGGMLISIESKFADPRLLLLKVMQEIRQQLTVAVQLADRLHSAREVEAFQREVLDAITAADPDTAARIKGALHQRRALRSALDPSLADRAT
jgi:hypothetical protein